MGMTPWVTIEYSGAGKIPTAMMVNASSAIGAKRSAPASWMGSTAGDG